MSALRRMDKDRGIPKTGIPLCSIGAWLNCLEGEYEDLFTGEKLEMNSVWMNPYQYRWCVKK